MTRKLGALLGAFGLVAAGPALALNICVEGAYPPFSEVAPDGTIVGFDIDIGQALCAQMGETCELVKVDWDGIIPALLEKKCDAIVASMSATEERKQVIDFSGQVLPAPEPLRRPRPTPASTTRPRAWPARWSACSAAPSTRHYMEAHYPDTELRLYGTQDEADLDLAAGRVDALMADAVSLDDGFLKTPAGRGLRLLRRGEPFRPGDPRHRRGDRRAQGGHRAARPAHRGDRRDPRRRHLPGDLRAVLRHRHLRRLSRRPAGRAAHGQPDPLRADPRDRRARRRSRWRFCRSALATLLGALGAAGRLGGGRIGRAVVLAYTTLVRGVPDLVMLLLVYFGGQRLVNVARRRARAWRRPTSRRSSPACFRSASSTAPI